MTCVETRYKHIVLEGSVPFISGTQMKIVELVEQSLAYDWSPEESQSNHPFLKMGQIHSALAYYWDHKDELDLEIERRLRNSDLRVRITINPEVCNGKPTIRGKRIAVQTLLELLSAGESREEILRQYPSLEPEDVDACLAFAG
jgi:uncharacterized protein (DUF433 family)